VGARGDLGLGHGMAGIMMELHAATCQVPRPPPGAGRRGRHWGGDASAQQPPSPLPLAVSVRLLCCSTSDFILLESLHLCCCAVHLPVQTFLVPAPPPPNQSFTVSPAQPSHFRCPPPLPFKFQTSVSSAAKSLAAGGASSIAAGIAAAATGSFAWPPGLVEVASTLAPAAPAAAGTAPVLGTSVVASVSQPSRPSSAAAGSQCQVHST
jgi:hypothetical protein